MKKTVLLLHGALSSKIQFTPLLPFLNNEEFDIHTLNFPGHGGDEIHDQPFSIPFFAGSILKYLDQKNIHATYIFGYSMGGYVAVYMAARFPERVKKIFTLATKFDWTPEVAEKEMALLNHEKISEKVPAFASFLEQTHSPQDWKIVVQKTADMLYQLGENPMVAKKDFYKVNIPVVIGLGESDKMVSIEESKNAAENLKNGRLLLLSATPHPFEKVNHQSLAGNINSFFSG